MSRQIKILFNGHDFKFLRLLISHFEHDLRYEVLLDEHQGHVIVDTKKSEKLLDQADIVFCEWCLGNAEWYSHNKKADQILIIRLHHQEVNLPSLERINWQNVDRIIFICQNNKRLFLQKFPHLEEKSLLIYNFIDCSSFDLPKLPGAEFNLGFVGTAPMRKAPHLAFEILKRLKDTDNRYTLFIKGKQPFEYDWLWKRPEEREYYEKFYQEINSSSYSNSVVFDPHGNDVQEWFSKIGFLLSTSDHEGSHQAVAEGMASGAIPVIRNWDGADQLYPAKYVFASIVESVDLIKKWNGAGQFSLESVDSKKYARKNFDYQQVIKKYDTLFSELLQQKSCDICSSEIPRKEQVGVSPKSIPVMHVCFLNPKNQSGYETRVIEETALLRKLGHPVVIACFISPNHFREPTCIWKFHRRLRKFTDAKIYVIPTDHFFVISDNPKDTKWITSSLIFIAKFHKIKIMHGQALYSTMHALRAREKLNVKVVFDVHGASPEENEMSGGHATRVQRLTGWEQHALQVADQRIFVSNKMNDFFLKKYNFSTLQYALLPCCVHAEEFHMSHEERKVKREQLGVKDKFVILYLGTLSVWQWPEAMFSLFSQIYKKQPDSLFYLLLPQGDHDRAKEFLNSENLPSDSYIIEEVPHDKVGSVIGIADVGLLLRKSHPVNYVASPTKFGEYMAAGVPIIATEGIGDTSDIITEENVGLIVAPQDTGITDNELNKLLVFIKNVTQNRVDWSLRCNQTASKHLEWDEAGQKLVKSYQNL